MLPILIYLFGSFTSLRCIKKEWGGGSSTTGAQDRTSLAFKLA